VKPNRSTNVKAIKPKKERKIMSKRNYYVIVVKSTTDDNDPYQCRFFTANTTHTQKVIKANICKGLGFDPTYTTFEFFRAKSDKDAKKKLNAIKSAMGFFVRQ
jgi:hypothetical protein